MRFGIFSNHVRGLLRGAVTPHESIGAKYDEDIAEIVEADRLGYEEAWISEHTAFPSHPCTPPSAELLIAKLSALTHQIRMGTAVRRIALIHPLQLATETASIDHLIGGRYMLGIGQGGPVTGYEQRGIKLADSHPMLLENIDLAIKAMTETEPFDWHEQFYEGTRISVWPKPLQQPHPPVAMASNTPDKIEFAARRGFDYLLSQTHAPDRMKACSDIFSAESEALGKGRRRASVTATRFVHVAPTDAEALAQVSADLEMMVTHNVAAGKGAGPLEVSLGGRSPLYDEWIPEGGTIDDLDLSFLLEAGMFFVGSPDTIAGKIVQFYEQAGGFGTLLLVIGKDIGSFDDRIASLRLFKEQVAPKLESLTPDDRVPQTSAVAG